MYANKITPGMAAAAANRSLNDDDQRHLLYLLHPDHYFFNAGSHQRDIIIDIFISHDIIYI
jgi:hypothetical protein